MVGNHALSKCSVLVDGELVQGYPEGDDGLVVVEWADSQSDTVSLSADGTADCHNEKVKTSATVTILIVTTKTDTIQKWNRAVATHAKFSLVIQVWDGTEMRSVINSESSGIAHYPGESIGQAAGKLEYKFNCLGCSV